MPLAENINLITSEKVHKKAETKMYLFIIIVQQLLPINMETVVRYEALQGGLLTTLICYTIVLSPDALSFTVMQIDIMEESMNGRPPVSALTHLCLSKGSLSPTLFLGKQQPEKLLIGAGG